MFNGSFGESDIVISFSSVSSVFLLLSRSPLKAVPGVIISPLKQRPSPSRSTSLFILIAGFVHSKQNLVASFSVLGSYPHFKKVLAAWANVFCAFSRSLLAG